MATEFWKAPEQGKPRVSLLSSVLVTQETGDERFNGGFNWEPDGCAPSGLYDVTPCIGSDAPSGEKSVFDTPAAVFTPGFGVYATDGCSGFGSVERDFKARALRNLDAARSMQIERQLWSDPLGLGGPKLADPSAVDLTPAEGAVSAARGLKLIEAALGDCTGGRQGVIHATPYAVGTWHETSLVRTVPRDDEQDRVFSYMGSIVVPGRGYDGSSPDGDPATEDEEWVYATGPVWVRLGEAFVNPPTIAEAFNRSTNDTLFYAEQAVAVAFDPNCCVLAVRVTRA